mmetsp:Transcript_9411/g.13793  ORF Transcript_9411/g.13793 Transcript_9411/m.13793 type:complete len:1459 (-) Transcript_9411:270-4646(-)|eukprot:CAMPEP_0195511820 /NCGR_PEP_ID=MMETSP0794_2-20130614/4003_1 /TAXON_ID=515487 /ORGANISM="Stephanopyxis turris, Strain CCMP 815" /LENGTH=1458 /DNA_ID=CAMNT_0040639485 /DNA_START=26 /DNA_END=4402 /DNA_ORIENTATION=+
MTRNTNPFADDDDDDNVDNYNRSSSNKNNHNNRHHRRVASGSSSSSATNPSSSGFVPSHKSGGIGTTTTSSSTIATGSNSRKNTTSGNSSWMRSVPNQGPSSKGAVRSSNPFESSNAGSGHIYYHRVETAEAQQHGDRDPIFAARNVDWPIPTSLSPSTLMRMKQISKALMNNNDAGGGSDTLLSSLDGSGDGSSHTHSSGSGSGGMMGGLLSRVLNNGPTESTSSDKNREEDLPPTSNTKLTKPNYTCVCASNGWIIACIETQSSPYLRFVHRWNVRRGTTHSSEGDGLYPLPPPLHNKNNTNTNNTNNNSAGGEIVGVFCDPTGSHAILSAKNGELYHLHSTAKFVKRCAGFGPDYSPITIDQSDTTTNSSSKKPHVNLTSGSYVTSVAWDKKNGTEGNTKKILLGTSIGELYEYSLSSPNQTHDPTDDASTTDNADGTAAVGPLYLHSFHEDDIAPPSSSSSFHGKVSGLQFEQLAGNQILLLAIVSGSHARTRLYSFKSAPMDTISKHCFRNTIQSHQNRFVELPGSIDGCDLCMCNDSFCVRTATGLYYGKIAKDGASMITDCGLLPYSDIITNNNTTMEQPPPPPPVSIAITPHHILTLSNNHSNEVCFISRVANKVVQREHVDWIPLNSRDAHLPPSGELLMDIRRPDQVWLRMGRTLVHISSSCEDRDVWRYTLEHCLMSSSSSSSSSGGRHTKHQQHHRYSVVNQFTPQEKHQEAQFELAKSLCSNSLQKAVVGTVRAEYHYARGKPEYAAKYFAQSPAILSPFSKTALRLCLPTLNGVASDGGNTIDAATTADDVTKSLSGRTTNSNTSNASTILYLTDKLRAASAKNDSVQCAMLGAWLVELHLHQQKQPQHKSVVTGGRNVPTLSSFLEKHAKHIDPATTIRILMSHDAMANDCKGYAKGSGDIATAVNACLSGDPGMNGAIDALQVLNESPIEKAEPFYYKHAFTLLSRAPMQTCKSFLSRYSHGLSPTKLLPSLMQYERKRCEYLLSGSKHNNLHRNQQKQGTSHTSNLSSPRKNNNVDVHMNKTRTVTNDEVEVQIDAAATTTPTKPNKSLTHFINDENAAVKYLEGIINAGCQHVAIYNYLISLYSSMEDEAPLFRFLTAQVKPNSSPSTSQNISLASAALGSNAGQNPTEDFANTPLDMSYALRKILNTGRHFRSAVKLYMAFGLRNQAVELALKVDPALARELAREAVGKEEKKRLWLMIARNAAMNKSGRGGGGGKDVVANVVSVIKDCGPDVLSIEDVLPFLPDFAQIDQFKDEICGALTSYSSKIDQYLQEMNECDETCDALRHEIQRLHQHQMHMKSDARCAFTHKLVLEEDEPFYVFPSGFVVLESALKKQIISYLNETQKERLEKVENELSKLRNPKQQQPPPGSNNGILDVKDAQIRRETLQNELDGLIAAECPLTGSMMVDSIDKGFASMDEDDSYEFGEWSSDKKVMLESI